MASDESVSTDTPNGDPGTARDHLAEAIAEQESLVARLDRERQEARQKLESLRRALASVSGRNGSEGEGDGSPAARGEMSAEEKVRIFRSLFRGRTDVYPTRFTSNRTGRPGYAPACRNKFASGLCPLPEVKCRRCPNQAFLPVDDAAITAHLRGRHVMGVYPLLEDGTCWFLAMDLDKSTWTEDVGAVLDTCGRLGLPAAVERSRSGNGAHIWLFFSSPVPARAARALGCHVVTVTMERRHQLGMDSYDRLFPSQDTLPEGGFGNLIALPLQREARLLGNTIFLDNALNPVPDADQWAYLAARERIDPEVVERIAAQATREGTVTGVRDVAVADEWDSSVAGRPPSRRRRAAAIPGPLPTTVHAVLSRRLFVSKAGLPPSLIDQVKRVAAFQNPEFFKRQSLRLSTALTPRVIACAEDLPESVGLPRGCVDELAELLRGYGVALDVRDERVVGPTTELRFHGVLTPLQRSAAEELLRNDIGVFVAPPGVGKTVVGTYLVAKRGCRTLILVHRRPLMDQWVAQLALFLGIEPKEIGRIGAGRRAGNGTIDVAMLQSLARSGEVDDMVPGYGQVIVDECHHLPAVSFERVLSAVRARFVVGLTATPRRRDGLHPITEMHLGPVRYSVDVRNGAAGRPFVQKLFVRETDFRVLGEEPSGIQGLYAQLAADHSRNELIVHDVMAAMEQGRSPVVLTERKDHLDLLADRLSGAAPHVLVLRGGMGSKERQRVAEHFAAIPEREPRLVLATGRYLGEGFDDARLDTLFLTMPVSWKGTLIQYAGRLQRLHPQKREVWIYDYVDRGVPVLARMYGRRLRGYRAMGYAADGESPASSNGAGAGVRL